MCSSGLATKTNGGTSDGTQARSSATTTIERVCYGSARIEGVGKGKKAHTKTLENNLFIIIIININYYVVGRIRVIHEG